MEIKKIDDGKNGAFIAMENETEAGKVTFVWAGEDKIILDHTEVESEFSGQGVGKKMVMAAVEFAREKNLKIIPLCPYAKSVFDKDPEIADVRAT
jgi:hypothetical protein